jgi:hypothetical protein
MTRLLSLVLCVLIAAPGCAGTVARQRRDTPTRNRAPVVDVMVMADYIRQLPIGSRVKVTRADGTTIRATLMKHDADPIVVQRRTRVPEAPVEIPVRDILAMELDPPGGGAGRSIAIGTAAAAGVTLGVLLLLAAIFSD